jgi:hypothetical protein
MTAWHDLTPDQQKQIDALLFARQKIQAIRLYREWTQAGLKQAKDAIEAREAELRKQSPDSFSSKPSGCFSVVLLAVTIMAAATWAGVKMLG